jgi:hypothetical protein
MSLMGRKYSTSEIVGSAKQTFAQQLGDQLQSLIHFGNHLNQSLAPIKEDSIQLLIVLKEINAGTLHSLADAYNSIIGKGQIAPMVMTEAEIQSSMDVFPTTFLEMKHHHELLCGEDVLDNLEIESTYLRIRCEQELKNLLLRLQANYITHYGQTRLLKTLFHNSFKAFVKTLHAVQVLFEMPFGQNREEVISQTTEKLELDRELFLRLSKIDLENTGHSLDSLHSLVPSLIELVAAAAASVDRIPDQVDLIENTDLQG